MPEFILDHGSAEHARAFNALDGFTQGYIEALFFTEEERLCEEGKRDMPSVVVNTATMETRFEGGESFGFSDLAPDSLARIIAECAQFQNAHASLLEMAYARNYDEEQAGRDYWFTRNGHGVGYWDRKPLEAEGLGEALSTAARYSERDAYVGDDGKVHLS